MMWYNLENARAMHLGDGGLFSSPFLLDKISFSWSLFLELYFFIFNISVIKVQKVRKRDKNALPRQENSEKHLLQHHKTEKKTKNDNRFASKNNIIRLTHMPENYRLLSPPF